MFEGIQNLPNDVQIFDQEIFEDERGNINLLCEDQLNKIQYTGFSSKITSSKANVARGMHWQNQSAPQIKAITVLQGTIIDFLINLDANSSEFGNFYSFKLDAEDNKTIIIPSHYGHGLLALNKVKFFYSCFGKYSPSDEISINLIDLISNNTSLSIDEIIVSKKDSEAKLFSEWETKIRS